LAYASNQDLSVPANYDAARAAMRQIKTDGGLPFGAWSNRKGRFLVVPPSLEGTARRLLHSELYAAPIGGATVAPISNIWTNDADLIVSEYLE
jgi:phage major head subunit gpT-like protein